MKPHSKKRHHRLPELRKRLPPGTAPGTLQEVPDAQPTFITLAAYSPTEYVEVNLDDFSNLDHYLSTYPVTWIHISGFENLSLIEELGAKLKLHNLSLEDALYAHHRTKIEAYEHYIFIVMQMVYVADKLRTEQLSMFLLKNCIVTFHEKSEDCLDPVRHRMRKAAGKIRNKGTDYLAYALIDTVIDNYYPTLQHYNDLIEILEMQVIIGFHKKQILEIYAIKTSILSLHRAVWPMREVLGILVREDSIFISNDTEKYLRDCYDHVIQLEELTEYCRDLTTGLMDLHLSFSSQKMNETMKFLTLVSTTFIPLNFIAGFYGMNFRDSPFNMPELGWRYGYFYVLALMVASLCSMFYIFKSRGWISSQPKEPEALEPNRTNPY